MTDLDLEDVANRPEPTVIFRWLWLPALLASAGLLFVIHDSHQIEPTRLGLFSLPFAGMVILLACSGRRFRRMANVQLVTTLAMVAASFQLWSTRQTDGFEWMFNNDLSFSFNNIANFIVFTGFLFCFLIAWFSRTGNLSTSLK